jgi:acyl-CoA thioester hydrolase
MPRRRPQTACPDAVPDDSRVETRLRILPEWTDLNGHMNVAYYVLAFDRATDAFYDALGIGWDYVARERKSLFTLAMNVDYLRELRSGDEVRIATRLADHDHKRLHYFHEMVHAADGWLAATNELLAMHVDMASRKSMPFPDRVAARLAAVQSAHAALSPPAQLGRRLGIRRGESNSGGNP